MSELDRELEKLGRAGNLDAAANLADEFETEGARTRTALEALLEGEVHV